MAKKRDTAIDFVRLVALFLVLNSHMKVCYGEYSILASGGGIGDALFFFAAGFALFLGSKANFLDWYKKRISRIYPSLFAVALIATLFFGQSDSFIDVVSAKRFWFIQCILALYPILFIVKEYCKRPVLLLCITSGIILGVFPFIYSGSGLFYGSGYYRWLVFFLFMLLGAIMGKERERIPRLSLGLSILSALFCIALWYFMVWKWTDSSFQILSVIPLMGVCIFTYLIGHSAPLEHVYQTKVTGFILISIGALCLDCYLVQKLFITDQLNHIFPWNIPLLMLIIIIASYGIKIISNIIRQLLDSKPMSWSVVIRPF